MKKRGFNLIELMVVIAIIAILAAVALPMYSSFQRKSKAAQVLKIVSESKQGLQAYYQQAGAFTGVNIDATDFRTLKDTNASRIGVSLGSVNGLAPSGIALTAAATRLVFVWGDFTGCTGCGGSWCIECDPDLCWTTNIWADPTNMGASANSDSVKADACT